MIEFIEGCNILSKAQYGFRKSSNTTLAIFAFVNDVLRSYSLRYFTVAIFLDLSRAFDTLNIDLLLYKLGCMGFRGVFSDFLRSYLVNRRQFVNVNNHCSEETGINLGVPQGSVLGPLLFNLYINDVIEKVPGEKIFYADDGVFYVSHQNFDQCIQKVKCLINELSIWLYNNKLIANLAKTKIMCFSRRKTPELPNIQFNGVILEWVQTFRYLGVIVDDKLSFTHHAQHVNMRLSKLRGIFYATRFMIPAFVMKNMYYSLVYSTLTYSLIIWGGTYNTYTNRIQVNMNNILRLILRIPRNENNVPLMGVTEMYKILNLFNFNEAYKFSLLSFIHFLIYERNELFLTYFGPLLPHHSYNTRDVRMVLPPAPLDIVKNFTVFKVCQMLNSLPANLFDPQSKRMLKGNFRAYLDSLV